jgi:adhesin/invasin
MGGVLTVGAGPSDTIKLLSAINPGIPVGGQAPAPFTVQVLASDGVTPVAGATVQFSSSPPVAFSVCSGAAGCTVLTDQSGSASTYMTVLSPVASIITAKLAPASYANPKQAQTTLAGTSSQLDLSLITPPVWVAQGATVILPVRARAMSNGTPIPGLKLNYQITAGAGSLSATSSQTDSSGNASVNLQVTSLAGSIRVTVCVAPNDIPCQVLNATMVQTSSLQLQPLSGLAQVAFPGQSFQPVSVRVVDAANSLHAIMGANVTFLAYIGRLAGNEPILWTAESSISQPPMPIILADTQGASQSGIDGVASFPLSTGGISGNLALVGTASVGTSIVGFEAQQFGP